jgi:hypothetical protein
MEGRIILQERGHEVSDEDLQQQKDGKHHIHPRNKDTK